MLNYGSHLSLHQSGSGVIFRESSDKHFLALWPIRVTTVRSVTICTRHFQGLTEFRPPWSIFGFTSSYAAPGTVRANIQPIQHPRTQLSNGSALGFRLEGNEYGLLTIHLEECQSQLTARSLICETPTWRSAQSISRYQSLAEVILILVKLGCLQRWTKVAPLLDYRKSLGNHYCTLLSSSGKGAGLGDQTG